MATCNPNLYSTSHQIIQAFKMYQKPCVTVAPLLGPEAVQESCAHAPWFRDKVEGDSQETHYGSSIMPGVPSDKWLS
jgi:prephenate dehydrogenase